MDTNGILEGSISMSGTENLAEICSCSEIFVHRNNGLQGWQYQQLKNMMKCKSVYIYKQERNNCCSTDFEVITFISAVES